MVDYIALAKSKIQILKDAGFELTRDMKILDFGCGAGNLVNAFLELGYDAYGVDVNNYNHLDPARFGKLDFNPYVIPFEDGTFDYIFSTSVFEHVSNKEESFREIYRVLKPGGVTTHSLPSRYRFIESHVKVPFAGMIQTKAWMSLWARLGVRNEYQKGLPWREVADRNYGYCKTNTHYISYRKYRKMIRSIFGNVRILKREIINNSQGRAAAIGRRFPIPGFGNLIFFFREWNLFMQKPVA